MSGTGRFIIGCGRVHNWHLARQVGGLRRAPAKMPLGLQHAWINEGIEMLAKTASLMAPKNSAVFLCFESKRFHQVALQRYRGSTDRLGRGTIFLPHSPRKAVRLGLRVVDSGRILGCCYPKAVSTSCRYLQQFIFSQIVPTCGC